MKFRLGLVIALTIAGCGELPEGDSKEDKESDGDGAPSNETDKGAEGTKPGPTAGDRTEIVNPELKLKRAYYKVFKNEEVSGTCYFLPRPDHTATAVAECDKKSDLGTKLADADFCTETADPNIINTLDCGFALEVSSLLNDSLRFDSVGPFLDEATKAEACTVEICAANSAMTEFCGYYAGRDADAKAGKPVTEIARLDSADEMTGLSQCANVLFGTTDPGAVNCEESKPGEGFECLQECGPPVSQAGDPPLGWAWLSAADARNLAKFGCPI